MAQNAHQRSPLLRLPGELRNRIYRHLLVSKARIIIARGMHQKSISLSHPPLALTCKQLHEEVSRIYYEENSFLISDGAFTIPAIDAIERMMGSSATALTSIKLNRRKEQRSGAHFRCTVSLKRTGDLRLPAVRLYDSAGKRVDAKVGTDRISAPNAEDHPAYCCCYILDALAAANAPSALFDKTGRPVFTFLKRCVKLQAQFAESQARTRDPGVGDAMIECGRCGKTTFDYALVSRRDRVDPRVEGTWPGNWY